MKTVHALLAIALFTASFDAFLVLNLGGGSLRLSQIMLLLVMLAAIAKVIQRGSVLWPRGASAMLLWCVIQALLILRSVVPALSAQLFALLMLPVFGVFAVVQLYGKSTWITRLMKVYLASFVFMAVIGLCQFVAPALHLGQPFIVQWIRYGLIPRVNAFSYEPSFFATYLILGWITLVDLRFSKAAIIQGRTWYWLTVLVSVVFFLTTSKTAWVFIMVEALARLAPRVWKLVVGQARRLAVGDLRGPLPRPRVTLFVVSAIILASLFVDGVSRVVALDSFLGGTGLGGTASHSIGTRYSQFEDTIKVVQEHPWLGVSLGGVAGRIAEIKGAPLRGIADLKLMWGFPVPVDIFAASGLFGLLPFVWFFWTITIGERSLIRANPFDERAKWLHALIRALAYEWLFFCADQNIVRMYFWFHISILMAVGYSLRYWPQPRLAEESQVSV